MCDHKFEKSDLNGGVQPTNDPNVQIIMGNCIYCGTTGIWGWIVNGEEHKATEKENILCELAIGQ